MTTKAQEVRKIIFDLYISQEGITLDAAMPQLVKPVMQLGGFRRQLARAYIKNSWHRVVNEAQSVITASRPIYVDPVVVEESVQPLTPQRQLSMTPSAIRKREQRARARESRQTA